MQLNTTSLALSICTLCIGSLFIPSGCVLIGSVGTTVGDESIGDDSAEASDDGGSASTGGQIPPNPTATSTSGGSVTTSSTSGGAPTASATATTTSATNGPPTATSGTGPMVDPDAAIEACGLELFPPGPEDPYYQEQVTCLGGCVVVVQSKYPIDLEFYSDCICGEMGCGPAGGDSTTGTHPPMGDTSTSGGSSDTSDTEGPSDTSDTVGPIDASECYDFAPGSGEFGCSCELCENYMVTDIDFFGVSDNELEEACLCICDVTGCGEMVGYGGGGPIPDGPF